VILVFRARLFPPFLGTLILPGKALACMCGIYGFLSQRRDSSRKIARKITLANQLYAAILNGRAQLLTRGGFQRSRRTLIQNGHNG
jgi:hypothetical protein